MLRIPQEDLIFLRVLGKGSCGEVCLVESKTLGEVAVKKTLLGEDELVMQEFLNEASLLSKMNSPYIIRFFGISRNKEGESIVMEYAAKGSLFHFLEMLRKENHESSFSWDKKYQMAQDITRGLLLMHSQGVLHRDMKSLNILLDKDMTAKISDFGFSKIKTKSQTTLSSFYVQNNVSGSLLWKAPESFSIRNRYTDKADIFALGIIFWEIATCQVPYEGFDADTIKDSVKSGKRLEIPSTCPERFKELIELCWLQEPKQRPTASNVFDFISQLITQTSNICSEHHTSSVQNISGSIPDRGISFQEVPRMSNQNLIIIGSEPGRFVTNIQSEQKNGESDIERKIRFAQEKQKFLLLEKKKVEEKEQKLREEHELMKREVEKKKVEEEQKRKLEEIEKENQRMEKEMEEYLEKQKKAEEERIQNENRIREEFEKRNREEEKRNQEEFERQKKAEEERIQNENRLREEFEKKKKEEEKRKQEEFERQKKAEEDRIQNENRLRVELEKKKREEEKRKQEEFERQKKAEEDRIQNENRLRVELEKKKKEEEKRLRAELEKKKREEEKRKQEEFERQKKAEEERIQNENRLRVELEKKKKEEEKRLRLELERQKKAEEDRIQNENRLRVELEKKKKEEEKRLRLELERQKKAEEDRIQNENRLRVELEKKKKEEEKRLRVELEKKKKEEEKRLRVELEKKKKEEEKEGGDLKQIEDFESLGKWKSKKAPDFEGNIFEAAAKGKLTSIIYLLANGTNVNEKFPNQIYDGVMMKNSRPLHFSSRYGHLSIVKYLVNQNADLNVSNYCDVFAYYNGLLFIMLLGMVTLVLLNVLSIIMLLSIQKVMVLSIYN